MFGPALARVRGTSLIQARSFSRPSNRHARDVIAFAARARHEKESNGSEQSNNSSGHGQRHNSRLPLRSTAVAGFSIFAATANSDNSEKPPQLSYAFRDRCGWQYLNSDPSVLMDFVLRMRQAVDLNSIHEARSTQFDFTHAFLNFCVHGKIIDEGPLPSDVVFGAGRHVKKEDTKVLWMPSPELGLRVEGFLIKALEAEICERLLEKFKEGSGRHIYVHVRFPTGFFSAGIDRDDLVNIVEREKSMSAIQE